MSLLDPAGHVGSLAALSQFRTDFHDCLTGRADALFELTDAVLCTDGPVRTLVGLALAPEHRRGHGALYAGLNRGRIDFERLRRTVAGLPLPRAVDGRLVLAADVSPWLRPDANTSPDRSFCHTYGRGKNEHKMIPGWPYSVIAALEVGRTSWTALLDAVRLEPGADAAAVTTVQVREVVERLMSAGQWKAGDPDILLVLDAGYDVQRLSFLLADLPLELLGRLRSDRVMRRPTPPRVYAPKGGRPPKHGGEFVFGQPDTWGEPDVRTTTETSRYGTAVATAFDRFHPRLTRRAAWLSHDAELPIIEGTVIRLKVDRLPTGGEPKPVWLWWSGTDADAGDVDRLWHAFLRRFDLEHTFRMIKQTLGWTRPKLRSPEAADRWTWLVIAAHTQLRLVRGLAADLRRPWERPAPPNKLTPARVRRGFRNLRTAVGSPAGAPKPTKAGPGRPPGLKNRRPAAVRDVGRVLKTGEPYSRPAHHKQGTKPRRVSD
ncbi:NF041680 family putative transposase [Streptomyces cyaneofuscatus]|uniref:NF041680 family putative transposase n=1 Tax=Streptomyces cyaneofuscatus TaxID=66883 RepID=UPI0036585754